MSWRGILGLRPLPLFLCFLIPWGEQTPLPCAPCHDAPGPRAINQAVINNGLNFLRPWDKVRLSSFTLIFSHVLVTATERWLIHSKIREREKSAYAHVSDSDTVFSGSLPSITAASPSAPRRWTILPLVPTALPFYRNCHLVHYDPAT